MIKFNMLLESVDEQKLISYISSLSKNELEDIAWNYALLMGDEDMKKSLDFIKAEIKNIKRHNKK